jgi:hypothetical protein
MRHVCFAVMMFASSVAGVRAAQEAGVARPASSSDVPKHFQFLYKPTFETGGMVEAWAGLPFDTITLERTRCYGECPAYKVTFYRGTPTPSRPESYEETFWGRAELVVTRAARSDNDRRGFPEAVASFDGRVNLFAFGRLSHLIQKSGLQMNDRYLSQWTDSSSAIVSVSGPGITKTVLDYGGVGPIELWGLQEAIDSAAKSIAWKRR